MALSQTDQFAMPPELGLDLSSPRQWHLCADFAATSQQRLLLTVIQVCRAGRESQLPAVALLGETGVAGVRIGNAAVRFHLHQEPPRVSCSAAHPDGASAWFEYSPT